MADKTSDKKAEEKAKEAPGEARTGGVTTAVEDTATPHDIFATSGSGPVRDKTVDPSKGTPVTRYFTKDGTPVEPSTVPPAATPANLQGFDADKREDVVAVVEYVNPSTGETVTHDNLKAAKEDAKNS